MSYDDTIKIIVLGDESVNKTSLILRYISGFFLDDIKLTIGVDFYSKSLNLDDKKIKLQIWDFAGEERFRFLLHQYCKGARGGLIVFDIADSSSLAHIDDWLSVIRKEDNIPIFLVGIIPDEKNKRRVSVENGKKIATSKNLNGYVECNLKTGENVERVFDELIRLMLADTSYTPSQRKDEDLSLNKDNLKEKKSWDSKSYFESKSKISSPKSPSMPPLPPPPIPKPPEAPTIPLLGRESYPYPIISSPFPNWSRGVQWIYCQKCRKKLTKEEYFTHSCKIKPKKA
ncbi:MAG: GTP-binding protein [Candidatus Lokiarchaeota archaeon]|nr:GTP-binding protein [Candidatus Lokiarchaeota archaeon]